MQRVFIFDGCLEQIYDTQELEYKTLYNIEEDLGEKKLLINQVTI
jgi:hypothetical protein